MYMYIMYIHLVILLILLIAFRMETTPVNRKMGYSVLYNTKLQTQLLKPKANQQWFYCFYHAFNSITIRLPGSLYHNKTSRIIGADITIVHCTYTSRPKFKTNFLAPLWAEFFKKNIVMATLVHYWNTAWYPQQTE